MSLQERLVGWDNLTLAYQHTSRGKRRRGRRSPSMVVMTGRT
ncbi:MAG: hypothetical protein ABIJ39_00820 [Chloroflexota bacterium]